MKSDIAIKVDKVSKSFKLPHEQHNSIKSLVVNMFNRKRGYERQQVLTDVSLEIKKGEFFGIVGRNGSGKSTLLKLLAGIYSPDSGTISLNGKLTPFIELGVGFNPDLTGRENVFLNGALLGFSRAEMEEMYDEIVTFAELEKFMDQKLKNYSSGMQVRLAFSIAIRAKTEILLIDEVLAVGDVAFQKKCYAVFQSLKREGRTVVFVTHGMSDVERFCDRVFVVDKGRQLGVFTPHEARVMYEKMNEEEVVESDKKNMQRWGSGPIRVDAVNLTSANKPIKRDLKVGDPIEVEVTFSKGRNPTEFEKNFVVGMNIFTEEGHNLFGPNTLDMVLPISTQGVSLSIPQLPLNKGKYFVTVAVFDEKLIETYDHLDRISSFTIDADKNYYGSLDIPHKWSKRS